MTLVNPEKIQSFHYHLQYEVQALCYLGMGYYLGRKYQQILPFTLAGGITATMIYQERKRKYVCILHKTYAIAGKIIAAASAFYLFRRGVGGNDFYKALWQGCYEFGIAFCFSLIDRIFFLHVRIPYLVQMAEKNDLGAQLRLAGQYYKKSNCGEAVQQDLEKSFKYYKLAADNGDVEAQNAIGYMYSTGEGVTKDLELAFKYYKLAADNGNVEAQNAIGCMYSTGEGVTKDLELAFSFIKKAADSGYSNAQYNVGRMYSEKMGVEEDLKQAFDYFKKAADQGLLVAFYKVGECYFDGKGVEKDKEKALEYWRLGSEQGHIECINKLKERASQ